jgi:hypothetical protein
MRAATSPAWRIKVTVMKQWISKLIAAGRDERHNSRF